MLHETSYGSADQAWLSSLLLLSQFYPLSRASGKMCKKSTWQNMLLLLSVGRRQDHCNEHGVHGPNSCAKMNEEVATCCKFVLIY